MSDLTTGCLKVRDEFASYQGTGILSGVRQYFVRLAGCKVKCPLRKNCDQQDALTTEGAIDASVGDLVSRATKSVGSNGWMHITGGEPFEHPEIFALTSAAKNAGMQVQIQTSGSIAFPEMDGVFVSVSPKQMYIMTYASEVILIACDWMTVEFATTALSGLSCPVFVVPEATNGEFSSVAAIDMVESLCKLGFDARMGMQSHLVWSVK